MQVGLVSTISNLFILFITCEALKKKNRTFICPEIKIIIKLINVEC
jgi:hypothetical protein